MRTGSTNSDMMMLVVPIAFSFALVIIVTGGLDRFASLIDMAVREAYSMSLQWLRSL